MLAMRRAQRGLTLIELAVGLTMLAILLGMAAPSFKGWIQNAQIRTAAGTILNGLQLARAEAVTRNTTVNFQLTDNLDATCTLSTSGKNWVVSLGDPTGKCDLAPSDTSSPYILQKRAGTEGTRNAAVTAGLSTISFNGLGRVTPPPAGNVTIEVTNPNSDRNLKVIVSTGGQIKMCDPHLTGPDPQACPI